MFDSSKHFSYPVYFERFPTYLNTIFSVFLRLNLVIYEIKLSPFKNKWENSILNAFMGGKITL